MTKTSDVSEALVSSLLDEVYEAAIDARRWPQVVGRLCEASHASGAMFAAISFVRPDASFLVTHGLDDDLTGVFLGRHQANPWSLKICEMGFGRVVGPRQLAAVPGLRHTDFYGEILQPQRLVCAACVNLCLGGDFATGGFGVYFERIDDARDDRAVLLLSTLAPHLQRAAATSLRLQQAGSLRLGCAAAFDLLPNAMLLVDGRARVLLANRAADVLLRTANGLLACADGLAALKAADTRTLRRLIGSAAQGGCGGALPLARLGGHAPLAAVVVPLRRRCEDGDVGWSAWAQGALVVVTDPEDAPPADAQLALGRLQALYGLTPAEARVALHVARGSSVPETAATLRIGAGTVHTHVKRVFAKAGVSRQAGLARLLTRAGIIDLLRT